MDSLKNPTFSEGGLQKNNIEGGLPKKGVGAWTGYKFKAWGDTPMHIL